MNSKLDRWKSFLIKKAISKGARLTNSDVDSLNMEDTKDLARITAVLQLIQSTEVFKDLQDMITHQTVFEDRDKDNAYDEWKEAGETANRVIDIAYDISLQVFSQQVLEDYRAMFEVRDMVDELNCK